MRIPKDKENWTGRHAERLIALAWKRFDEYEKKVDFDQPQEVQNDLYLPYQVAKNDALEVARYTQWMVKEAEALP